MNMRKMTAIVAGGVGYVLGARAGRERYDQIVAAAQKIRSNPKVQQTAQQAADAAKEAAPVVKDKVSSAADTAKDKASSSGKGDVPLEESAYPKS
jgi:hypothetical protein